MIYPYQNLAWWECSQNTRIKFVYRSKNISLWKTFLNWKLAHLKVWEFPKLFLHQREKGKAEKEAWKEMKAADLHFQQLEGCDHSPHYIIITILQIKRPESKKLEDFSQSWIWDSAAKEISQSALTQTLIIQNPYMQNCFSSNFEHHRNTSALIIPAIDVYQSISSASPDVKELSVAACRRNYIPVDPRHLYPPSLTRTA